MVDSSQCDVLWMPCGELMVIEMQQQHVQHTTSHSSNESPSEKLSKFVFQVRFGWIRFVEDLWATFGAQHSNKYTHTEPTFSRTQNTRVFLLSKQQQQHFATRRGVGLSSHDLYMFRYWLCVDLSFSIIRCDVWEIYP